MTVTHSFGVCVCVWHQVLREEGKTIWNRVCVKQSAMVLLLSFSRRLASRGDQTLDPILANGGSHRSTQTPVWKLVLIDHFSRQMCKFIPCED